MVVAIAEIYRQFEQAASAYDAQRAAESWLEHRLAHVGLLEEDDRGNVYFAHWSLMQHLVACASPAAAIAPRIAALRDLGLYFFACEIHVNDPDFLGEVADAAVAAPEVLSSHWLIRLVAAGIPFTSAAVVAACGRLAAAHHDEIRGLAETGRCSTRLSVAVVRERFERRPSYTEPGPRRPEAGSDEPCTTATAAPIAAAMRHALE